MKTKTNMKTNMKTKMLALIALLLLSLSLTACLGGRGVGADAGDTAAQGAGAQAATQFLAACVSGDTATALDSLTADVRQAVIMTGSDPCSGVSAETADAVHLSTETVGRTTTVAYTWQLSDGTMVYYRALVREEAGQWLIFDVHKEFVPPTRVPGPTPLSPPYTIPRP
jgi:predicted small secreted protein